MLSDNNEIYIFLITLLKCFLILIILGILLPEIFDKLIMYFVNRHDMSSGSDFVYNIINGREFIVRFMYYFKLSLR